MKDNTTPPLSQWPDPLRTQTANAYLDKAYHEAIRQGRGGSRPRAGRKPDPNKKLTISFRVSPETRALWDRARAEGFDVQKEMDGMIRELCNELLKGDQ